MYILRGRSVVGPSAKPPLPTTCAELSERLMGVANQLVQEPPTTALAKICAEIGSYYGAYNLSRPIESMTPDTQASYA